jgi:hypothetical protein
VARWNAVKQHQIWDHAAVNVSNTAADARQAIPKPQPTEEWPGMEEAVRASLEIGVIEPKAEDSDSSESIEWNELEASTDEQGEESESLSPPPKDEPGDKLE